MKRKVVLYAVIVLFYVLLIGSVVFINNPKVFEKKKSNAVTYEDIETGVFTCDVELCSFEKAISATGMVKASGDNDATLSEISVPNRSTITVKIGDEIKKGDVVAGGNGEEVKAQFDGKVIGIYGEGNEECLIKAINYSSLCISTQIGLDLIPQITSAERITVGIDGNSYDVFIREIGYTVENNAVEVVLSCPRGSFLGDPVHIDFVTDEIDNCLAIPRVFLYTMGKKHYVYKCSGEHIEKTFVEVGENFKLNDEEFIEIRSGLVQGDTVISQNEQEYAQRLNRLINNE